MVDEVFHLQAAPKNPFHNGGGSGELPKKVMVEIEVIPQRFASLCIARNTAATPANAQPTDLDANHQDLVELPRFTG